ncbi:FAD-dependent oxidoreductase [Chitinilyticum litopenaei]|uniref:FAD-dependent oxidoreductase n=1 Tax=Chitinilyticum litopenaei TaxID=1121276 RepID=UPI00040B7EA7|nr:bifunctional TVP38/TMEM64 family protein/FAD-dependent oxidoreductase [Chitinilyticum litopenaei]
MKRLGLLILIGALLALFFALGGSQLFSLATLKQHHADLLAWRAAAPWLAAGLFFLLYVASTALSLPGAAILTLAAGALFGLRDGLVLVSFASSLGATLAFLTARYLLRDTVQCRFGSQLAGINAGIARDGAVYLFTLRLVPAFPFFLINLLLGLSSMRVWTFYWVSQLGMLAGTVVYVNAGTRLAGIDSLADIVSPSLLFSFALLGIFPLLAKALVRRVTRYRVYRGWRHPARFDRNLVVIGAGAAGLVSAYLAAAVKARVTLVEAHRMGGDCLNYGCVPSKALIASAKVAHQLRHADHYGLQPGVPAFRLADVMARVRQVIAAVAPHDSIERYTALGVDVQQGYARLLDPWTVAIRREDGSEHTLTARSIIIAAGARPVIPALPGLEQVDYYTSDTLWDGLAARDTLPARLLVLGGGPIGCELAQAFARLGATVTQVERGEALLGREDADVTAQVTASLQADGVEVLTGATALRCLRQPDGGQVLLVESDGAEQALAFDALILAVGRRARLEGYGLEALGIATERTVQTNDYLETLYPNILAAGDVAGPYQFTHAAAHQAWYASVNALFGQFRRFRADYRIMPRVTFVDPEVARVGLSEREAQEQGIAYEVSRYGIDDLDRALADGQAHGFVKVLTVPGKDRILGVTIVGPQAGELLAEYVLAMKHGLGLNRILATIHSYPTLAEANKYAAGVWKRAHAPQTVLRWLARYHRWRLG